MPVFNSDLLVPQIPRQEAPDPPSILPTPSESFTNSETQKDVYQNGLPTMDEVVQGIALQDQKRGNGFFSNAEPQQSVTEKELLQNTRFARYTPGTNNEELASNSQGTFSRLGNAAVNLVGKTAAYALQNIGFIGGAPGALGGDISNMTDNFIVKASDWLKDKVENNFPIYHSAKYQEGSIWQKLATSSWWLDDGIDRAALTAAMFIPGLAEAKGIGLAGATFDAEGSLIKATGIATKGLEGLAENPKSYSWIGKTFLPKLYKAAATGVADEGVSPALAGYARSLQRAELYGWNVIGQSALNAKETQEGIRTKLSQDRGQGLNTLSDDEIANKAADGAKASFWETVPVTLAGSLVELPQMFSTARTAKSLLDKIINPATGEALENIAEKSSLVGLGRRAVLTALEHGQNESLQVAISRFNEDRQEGKDVRNSVDGIFGDYLDNINDPNGQNNIALGTIQGFLTSVLGAEGVGKFTKTGQARAEAETEYKHNLLNIINESRLRYRQYNSQQDLVQRDENNVPIINEDGTPKFDQDKLAQAGISLADIQDNVIRKTQAIALGDYTTADKIDHDTLASIAYPYLSDKNGMEHLVNMLTIESKNINPDRIDEDSHGNSLTPLEQLNRNINTVKQLKSAYDAIDQRHAGFFNLGVDANDKTKDGEGKTKSQRASEFLHYLKHAQYVVAANQIGANDRIAQNTAKITSLASQNGISLPEEGKGIENPSSPAEEQINDLLYDKYRWEDYLTNEKGKYKTLVDKSLWKDAFNKNTEQVNGYISNVFENKPMKARRAENIKENATINKGDFVQSKESPFPSPKRVTHFSEDGKFAFVEGTNTGIPVDELSKHPTFDVNRSYTAISSHYKNAQNEANHTVVDSRGNELFSSPDRAVSREKAKQLNEAHSSFKVVSINDDGSANVEYKNGDTGTIPLENIVNYTPEATDEEIQLKEAENNKDIKETEDKTSVQTVPKPDKLPFESSKKADNILFTSTAVPNKDFSGELKPHHFRANYFGAILPTLKNRENIRAIVINEQIEGKYGLTGLTSLVKGTYVPKGEDDTPLIGVMAEKDGEDYHFVNEKGARVGKLGETTDVNQLVFQTLSTPDLVNSKGNPKYRNTSDATELEKLSDSYKQLRKRLLSDSPNNRVYQIDSSFGFLKENIAKDERHPISTITKDASIPIIKVSTTADETISNAFQTIKAPLGRPFIKTDNTIQQLDNRHLTENEQSVVYNLIIKLSDIAANKQLKTQEAQNIFSFLKGLVYWGTPNNEAGKNSIWFDGGLLHFGNKQQTIPFTKQSIEKNKNQIQGFLAGMYNNINSTYLSPTYFNNPFYEITDANKEPVRWNTYQEYLVSDTYPDGTQRPLNEIPLTTNIPPILPKGVDSLNNQTRQGIYFVLQGLSNELYKTQAKQQEPKSGEPILSKQEEAAKRIANLLGGKAKTTIDIPIGEKKEEIPSRNKEEIEKEILSLQSQMENELLEASKTAISITKIPNKQFLTIGDPDSSKAIKKRYNEIIKKADILEKLIGCI